MSSYELISIRKLALQTKSAFLHRKFSQGLEGAGAFSPELLLRIQSAYTPHIYLSIYLSMTYIHVHVRVDKCVCVSFFLFYTHRLNLSHAKALNNS